MTTLAAEAITGYVYAFTNGALTATAGADSASTFPAVGSPVPDRRAGRGGRPAERSPEPSSKGRGAG